MKRGYYVYNGDWGIAVVANSVKSAKKIAFASKELDCDWCTLRVRWMRKANVKDLAIGVIDDMRLALLRGIFDFILDCACDRCGEESQLICFCDEALCETCIEKENTHI